MQPIKLDNIKSPLALAAFGAFFVPEPLGACFVMAAAIWWSYRKLYSAPISAWPTRQHARLCQRSTAAPKHQKLKPGGMQLFR